MINLNRLKYLIFGYVRVPNAVDSVRASEFRAKMEHITDRRDRFVYAEEFYKEGLHEYFFSPALVQVYRDIFDENYKISVGGTLHHDNHGIYLTKGRVVPGVHVDSDYQYFNKDSEMLKLDHRFAKLGIFFQDSDLRINILAIPCSHIVARFFGKLHMQRAFLLVLRFSKYLLSRSCLQNAFRPKIRVGDALIFDCLLIHASDVGRTAASPKKLVLYTEVGEIGAMHNFYKKTVIPRALNEIDPTSKDQKFERDPMRYNKQVQLASGKIGELVESRHREGFYMYIE